MQFLAEALTRLRFNDKLGNYLTEIPQKIGTTNQPLLFTKIESLIYVKLSALRHKLTIAYIMVVLVYVGEQIIEPG